MASEVINRWQWPLTIVLWSLAGLSFSMPASAQHAIERTCVTQTDDNKQVVCFAFDFDANTSTGILMTDADDQRASPIFNLSDPIAIDYCGEVNFEAVSTIIAGSPPGSGFDFKQFFIVSDKVANARSFQAERINCRTDNTCIGRFAVGTGQQPQSHTLTATQLDRILQLQQDPQHATDPNATQGPQRVFALLFEVDPSQNPDNSLPDANLERVVSMRLTPATSCTAPLTVTKSDSQDPVKVNDLFNYTVTITNNTNDILSNVRFEENIPLGLRLSTVQACGGAIRSDGFECIYESINPGATEMVTFSVIAETPGQVTNSITVTAESPTSTQIQASASEETQIIPLQANLTITKIDSKDPVLLGEEFTYTVKITNNGPDDALNLTFEDILPNSLQGLLSNQFEIDGCFIATLTNNTLFCDFASRLRPSESHETTFRVLATALGTFTNEVNVSSSSDISGGQTSASEQTEVRLPQVNLSITKSDSKDPVIIGEEFIYTINVTNNGPDTATDVRFQDALPLQLAPLEFLIDDCTIESNGIIDNIVDCAFGNISSGTTKTARIRVRAIREGTITNEVNVTTTSDNNGLSSAAEQTTIEVPSANLAVTKTADKALVVLGETVTYIIKITNNGNNTAVDVQITDVLPNSFDSGVPSGCRVDGQNNLVCLLGPILPGSSKEQIIVATPREAGSFINAVTVTTETLNIGESEAQVTTDVVPPEADLEILKFSQTSAVSLGEQAKFTIQIANLGPAPTIATISDTLEEDLRLLQIDKGNHSFPCSISQFVDGTFIRCSDIEMQPGQTVQFDLIVLPEREGLFPNTAQVSGSLSDSNLENNMSTSRSLIVEDQLFGNANLAVEIQSNKQKLIIGEDIAYTLTVQNNGPDDAEGVILSFLRTDRNRNLIFLPDLFKIVGANCDINSTLITCTLGSLTAGVTRTIKINLGIIGATSTSKGLVAKILETTASVASTIRDADVSNNIKTLTITDQDSTLPPLTLDDPDINSDDCADTKDAAIIGHNIGTDTPSLLYDFNQDGTVDILDLFLITSAVANNQVTNPCAEE